MTEIKTDSTVIVAGKNANIRVDAAPDAPAAAGALPHEMSKGEKWYNWTVYSGINYWVNLIGSVWLADEVLTGKLKKPFEFGVGKVAQAVDKLGINNLNKSYHGSKIALETLALTGGGWLLLVPMKFMEDRKRPIVHWLNKKFGIDQTAPDGHELTADEIYIEKEQPKQNWTRVIGRRLLASVIVVGSGSALDHLAADRTTERNYKKAVNPYDSNSEIVTHVGHLGGKERATEWIVNDVVGKGASLFPGGNNLFGKLNQGAGKRWIELLALDTFFTKITAITMFVTNGAKKEKPEENLIESTPSMPLEDLQTAAPKKLYSDQIKPRPTSILINQTTSKNDRFVDRITPDSSSNLQPGIG